MRALVLVVVTLTACVQSAVTVCEGGFVCPPTDVCDEIHGACVRPEQLRDCVGLLDLTECMIVGDPVGICRDEVCVRAACGDGVKFGSEQCDLVAPETRDDCTENGFHTPGPVTCTNACTLDVSGCQGRCGDGVLDPGEACDSNDTEDTTDDLLGGRTCVDFGFYNADSLSCSLACTLDVSSCDGFCGDRAQDAVEICEGQAPPDESCLDYGFESGTLGCLALCAPDFTSCSKRTWTKLTSAPSNAGAVWAAAPDDVFATAGSGVVRWNGVAWTPMTVPATGGLYEIWGTSATDVFAVGDLGAIVRWSGTSWQAMASGTTETLFGVYGNSGTDVFAVGTNGTIRHWNGSNWGPMSSGVTEALLGVWSWDATTAFAVGAAGTILELSGTTWSPVTVAVPAFTSFNAVWGSAPDNVYAVGDQGLIVHYDGIDWTVIPSPTQRSLRAVWGSGPDDVYAVGLIGVVAHWDGNSWTATLEDTAIDYYSVSGTGPADVVVLGTGGTALQLRSSTWSRVGTTGRLNSAWSPSDDDGFVAGWFGVIRRWNGSTWQDMTSNTSAHLGDLWGTSATNVYAIGIEQSFSSSTVMKYSTANGWENAFAASGYFNSVWGTAANNVYVAGSPMTYQWNGSTWAEAVADDLIGIWGSGPNDVFGVGFDGHIQHFDGSTWSLMVSNTSMELDDVWGSGPNDVFAVGRAGTILHYNGSTWSPMNSGTQVQIYSISGTGPNNVYAVDDIGTILHFDGYRWSPMASPTGEYLYGVFAHKDVSDVLAVGGSGSILRRPRGCPEIERACGNGEDDDCDGYTDCGDPDCDGVATCTAGGVCAGFATLACNAGITGTTLGATSTITRYGCSPWLETGREKTYKITPAAAGTVTVKLSGLSNDLDLVVLDETSTGGCEPHLVGCRGASSIGGFVDEMVTFTAAAGKSYFVVVDGYGSNSGQFALDVTCP